MNASDGNLSKLLENANTYFRRNMKTAPVQDSTAKHDRTFENSTAE